MVRLYLLLALAQIVLTVVALISCVSAEEDEFQNLPRLMWVLIIVLLPVAGSIAWFIVRRRATNRRIRVLERFSVVPARKPSRPIGPDDDPEFLRSIDVRRRSEPGREPFRSWESDRRSDDDSQRGDGPPEEQR
jgi:hypothetical protein